MEKLPFDEEALVKEYEPDFAFAYGSGVFRQAGYRKDEQPMVDLVFAVDDPKDWHRKNMLRHPDDYAPAMRWLGPGGVSQLQALGPGVLYNTYVPFQGASLKYGVTSCADLRDDLTNWDSLYLAGRLQKPVHILQSDDEIEAAMEMNYCNAVNTARLLLSERFMEHEFYHTVAGLSYIGDSRNGVAENPTKVQNIVSQNSERFRAVYHKILASCKKVQMFPKIGQVAQDTDPYERAGIFRRLPLNLQRRVDQPIDFRDHEALSRSIRQGIARIVAGPTRIQTVKGVASSGLRNSLRYGAAKLSKSWRR